MHLIDLGWDEFFENKFASLATPSVVPARVARENKLSFTVHCEHGELLAEVSGKFRHETQGRGDFPTVGDWVAVTARAHEGRGTIHALLPRKSAFVRKVAGENTIEQVVAANIDTVFIVCGLDSNFNVRRVERYLSLGWESGAVPVILLNKADLCDNVAEYQAEIEAVAFGVEVHSISATQRRGLDALNKYFSRGKTAAFLGSSGVGKSTIINSLLGTERLPTAEVRESDSRGRHTTTYRELIILPNGGIVIDTPGMRELQVWGDDRGLRQTFEDIEALAAECRFRNCGHQSEPGCAVQAAIKNGALDAARFESYRKLQRELIYLAARQRMKANAVEKARWKKISLSARNLKKKG